MIGAVRGWFETGVWAVTIPAPSSVRLSAAERIRVENMNVWSWNDKKAENLLAQFTFEHFDEIAAYYRTSLKTNLFGIGRFMPVT